MGISCTLSQSAGTGLAVCKGPGASTGHIWRANAVVQLGHVELRCARGHADRFGFLPHGLCAQVEKDEDYIKTVVQLGASVEDLIKQNNAVDIYQVGKSLGGEGRQGRMGDSGLIRQLK